ncbi:discoidin domain-containing protein [Planctomycetota bacterium]
MSRNLVLSKACPEEGRRVEGLVYLVSLILVLFLMGAVQAEPLNPDSDGISDNLSLWLRAPDTYFNPSDGIWADVSPKGNDAEPVGLVDAYDITYVEPTLSTGSNSDVFSNDFSTVRFAPSTDDLMWATNLNGGVGTTELTIFAVYKLTPAGGGAIRAVGFGSISGEGLNMGDHFNLSADMNIKKDNGAVTGSTAAHPDDQFFIRVARMNSTDVHQWLNTDGTLVLVHEAPGTAFITSTDNFYLGDLRAGASPGLGNLTTQGDIEIAEVVVYNTALSEPQIEGISEWLQANVGVVPGAELSQDPSPAHGATDVPQDVSLSWTPGKYADQHDIYLGTNFADVNDATTDSSVHSVYKGRQNETLYIPDPLDLGQTYYWRVDEVSAPSDNTIFKGNTWSFTVEPVAYPLPSENITATASSSNKPSEGPENTINGSGLDDNDLHSATNTDMWLSSAVDPDAAWIQYELDTVYKLHEMLVWNHNSSLELAVGFGIREATIEYSIDGNDWTTLGDFEFAQASGTAGLSATNTVDLSGVAAKYVKIIANSNWGGVFPQKGLSEVRLLAVPVNARELQPVDGTVLDDGEVTLSWRSGREAAEHEIYMDVNDNQGLVEASDPSVLIKTLAADEPFASHTVTALNLSSTYVWKVTEVNTVETPASYDSSLMRFTTPDFVVVDDMDQYTFDEGNRIWEHWLEGSEFGIDDPANGSTIGSDPLAGDFSPATGLGRGQSLPIWINVFGEGGSRAEATRLFDPAENWSQSGITTLSLFVQRGSADTGGDLYVRFNGEGFDAGTKVPLVDNSANPGWVRYNVDLTGLDVSSVTSLSVGIEGGKDGDVIYMDDVRLYAVAPEL